MKQYLTEISYIHCVNNTHNYQITPIIMLEYIKTILVKVSFDQKLFEKELRKSFTVLVKEELVELKKWCYAQFASVHEKVLNQVFAKAEFAI